MMDNAVYFGFSVLSVPAFLKNLIPLAIKMAGEIGDIVLNNNSSLNSHMHSLLLSLPFLNLFHFICSISCLTFCFLSVHSE